MTYGTPCDAIGHFIFYYHNVTYRTPYHASDHLVIYASAMDLRERFLLSGIFFILHSFLLVLRLPWDLAV